MALSEFTNAFGSVAADLERMYRGFKEGRGGAREAGVRDLVSFLPARVYSKLIF
jgi:exocyst complex protein 7